MEDLLIRSKIRDYRIKFLANFDFLYHLNGKNVVFAVDYKFFRIYKNDIFKNLIGKNLILIEATERSKSLRKAIEIYKNLIKRPAKRNLTLISIGGGTVQDVTGFVASTLYRGITWIYTPTTLLSQADSCIGGKTSLNLDHAKNIIGTFYPPKEVYINYRFLETLDIKDYYSGMGEIIKLQLMVTKRGQLKNLVARINQLKEVKVKSKIQKLIRDSLVIKKKYIEEDEFDLGKRNLLNYGHTLGHALESSSKFKIPHGIAVIIGMIFANLISVKRNLLDLQTFKFLNDNLFLPNIHRELVNFKNSYFELDFLLNNMVKDKKRISNNLTFVIPDPNLKLFKVSDLGFREFSQRLSELLKILII